MTYYYGGGGGGGYYGGGGSYYGSAGGGSSYPVTGATTAYCSGVTNTSGYQAGTGYVSICAPNVGTIGGNIPLCSGQTNTLIPTVSGGTCLSQYSDCDSWCFIRHCNCSVSGSS